MMLKRHDLHPYQVRAIEHIRRHRPSMLWLDMSLGKTTVVLTGLLDMFADFDAFGALVVAPRRVAETVWAQEARKWEHLLGLKICILRGANKNLLARELLRPYHIWVINYEALPWLIPELNKLFLSRGKPLPFDVLVLDEVTRAKNETGARIGLFYAQDASGRMLFELFNRRIGLTGTPVPNGYWDLFGQYLIIDGGSALGRIRNVYKEQYFCEDPESGRRYLAKGAKEAIEQRIGPITLNMSAEEYLDLPDYIYNDLWVDLPPKAERVYRKVEEEMLAELDHTTVELFNAASVTAKCRQIANGIFLETETGIAHGIHDAKLEAFDEIMEEAAGQPVLGAYVFRADMERLRKRYSKTHRVGYLGPGVGDNEAVEIINTWNSQGYDLLLVHHASAGHGLNLQHGGHIVAWLGLDWPLEGWLQLNARLRRQGQQAPSVIIHRVLARGTIDEAILDRLTNKEKDQDDLRAAIDALQRYRQKLLAGGRKP